MNNEVILGDCFDILEKIDSNSIDLILTDPPYNISRESNFKKNSENKKFNNISIDFGDWDQKEINLDKIFFESKRILKKGGTIIIFYDVWKSLNIKFYAEKYGFKQSRICQWVKTNPVPINSKKNYLSNAIEFFFTFVKSGSPTFNSEYDRGIYNFPICHGNERTNHPTQKPLKLIQSIIEKHSKEGDIVLDPFGGSGTTAVASLLTKRSFILIEQNIDYYNLSLERIEQISFAKI
jgi:site-specific DNA-methyltransferase (adenine-specific)